MIVGYDRSDFGEKLSSVVSPSRPVRTVEQLVGREKYLAAIEKALFAPGRHIFIYGDRGVGKSSLAATAASQYQSSDATYIDLSCSPDASLRGIVANAAYQALGAERLQERSRASAAEVNLRYLKWSSTSEVRVGDLASRIHSLVDAVEVLREVAQIHSKRPIVVVDEFDRIESQAERSLFADLVKQLGDKDVPIKFIFTGVAHSLTDLLGSHQSAIRQFETIELPKLTWEGRFAIVVSALRAFNIDIGRDIYMRIAAVSDGYPYYVHLITEKLLWILFEEEGPVASVGWGAYRTALRHAIESISAELRQSYQRATSKHANEYEPVLWSTADSDVLDRYLKEMYQSYERVMQQLRRDPLSSERYRARIRSLASVQCGSVLKGDKARPGLYRYTENMLRGFVRMQAEAAGVQLGEIGGEPERQSIHVPVRVATGLPFGFGRGRRPY